MNPDAFENIIYKNKRYYIGKETIGSKDTYFLYAPVFNIQGRMIAIMCSPFTDESFDFRSEAVLHSITVITVLMTSFSFWQDSSPPRRWTRCSSRSRKWGGR